MNDDIRILVRVTAEAISIATGRDVPVKLPWRPITPNAVWE
jgi:hypothetical protein